MKIRDLFKRKKQNNTDNQIDVVQEFEIQIEGDINLFEGEKEKIIEAAKQLLEIGKADDIQDAIISIGVIFRGLKFSEVQKTKDGKTIIVFSEVGEKEIHNKREELIDELSNNGEYLNLSEKREIVSGKDIDNGEIYYKIGDKEHKIPTFEHYIKDKEEQGISIPLEKRSNGKYLIVDEEMSLDNKYDMLRNMLDRTLKYVTVLINQVLEDNPNQPLKEKKDSLCRTADVVEYVAKKSYSENKIEEANEKLSKKIEEVLALHEELLESEKDIEFDS